MCLRLHHSSNGYSEITNTNSIQVYKINANTIYYTHPFNGPLSRTAQVSQTDNNTSTPPFSFLQAGCSSCRPTNSVKALKALILIY